jgi:peptidoglycan/LPS O-acetylase OafA/YrhL
MRREKENRVAQPGKAVIPKGKTGHILALDGIRGAAILAVMTYHAARNLQYVGSHEQIVQGLVGVGWIGVDLFFVLSGFLITGILLDAKGSDGYFRSFYARRVLRIFPLYLTFVALATWIAPAMKWTTTHEAAVLRGSQGWYWTYLVNGMIARGGWSAAVWKTGHLWSLSVEEQFYLLWPALVFLVSRRTLVRTGVGILLAGSVLRAAFVAMNGPAIGVYVLLPTRMDGLAMGAVLAALARDPESWRSLRRWTIPSAVTATAMLAFVYRRDLLEPTGMWTEIAGFPALSLLFGATIVSALSAPDGSWRASLWKHPLMRFFGRYSYGLYVWHQLAITWFGQHVLPANRLPVVGGSHLPGNALFVLLAFAVSVAAALVSWHVLEYPFLKLKRLVPYRQPRSDEDAAASSRNVTTPVSSEYLAPTITRPSF